MTFNIAVNLWKFLF